MIEICFTFSFSCCVYWWGVGQWQLSWGLIQGMWHFPRLMSLIIIDSSSKLLGLAASEELPGLAASIDLLDLAGSIELPGLAASDTFSGLAASDDFLAWLLLMNFLVWHYPWICLALKQLSVESWFSHYETFHSFPQKTQVMRLTPDFLERSFCTVKVFFKLRNGLSMFSCVTL